MVEVKLCLNKLDGATEYRRIAIPVLTQSTDVLSVLREKLFHLFPELQNDSNGIDIEFQYEDDSRGLVLVTTSEGINQCARNHASRQQILRVFVKFSKEDFVPLKYLPSKHVGIICNGCNRSPLIGIRYKCLECFDYDLCETCADKQLIHAHHVMAKIRTPHQGDVVKNLCSSSQNQLYRNHKGKLFESKETQTNSMENDVVDDDMEIVSSNIIQDDFVQLDLNEFNQQ